MGRARRLDVRRHPSGRIDYGRNRETGTPEAVARRLILVRGEDPALAESPLGIARARGLIDEAEMEAGRLYAVLYARAVGRRVLPGAARLDSGDPDAPAPEDPIREAERRERFLAAKAALLGAGRPAVDQVENLCVFRRWPRFLVEPDRASRLPAATRDLVALRAGLGALARFFGLVGARRVA